jgi:NADH-quinone oxidoreductase subunit N
MISTMIMMTAFAQSLFGQSLFGQSLFGHTLPGLMAQVQAFQPPQFADYMRILPELVLSVFGMLVMVVDPLLDEDSSHQVLGSIALIGTLAALVSTFYMSQYPGTAFWNMVRVEDFSVFFHYLVIAIAAVAILSSFEYLRVQRIRAGEYYGLILFGTVGMCLMSSAIELVLIFIALEISSISTYVLAGFRRREASSSEASLKYFLLGSFATAFFLYGVALMFGATGSTNIDAISLALHSGNVPVPVLAYVATALMFVGLGFKVASVPFHIWTPDVYEGAPAPVVGLMSTGPKAAAFAILLRVLFEANAPGRFWLIWVSAALTMTLGNLGALVQDNVKRLLAYSSIAHAGYVLVAFAALPELGTSAAMFYTAAYAAMNVGAFAVVSHFANAGEKYVTLEDYAGLGRKSPALAATFTFFLMSFIGIPITGGFFAKFYVLSAALKSNLVGLAIILVLNSAVGAYYYLRIIVMMYMREPRSEVPVSRVPAATGVAITVCVLLTLYLGVLPGRVLDYSAQGAKELVRDKSAQDMTTPGTSSGWPRLHNRLPVDRRNGGRNNARNGAPMAQAVAQP